MGVSMIYFLKKNWAMTFVNNIIHIYFFIFRNNFYCKNISSLNGYPSYVFALNWDNIF